MSFSPSVLESTGLGWPAAALALAAAAIGWKIAARRGAIEVARVRAALELEVAEHKRASNEASAAQDRLTLAMEASRLVLWDYDIPSGNVTLSEAWSALLGLPPVPTTATIQELTALVPEEDRAKVAGAMSKAMKGPDPGYRVDHRVVTPAGGIVWIVSEGRVVQRDPRGRAIRMLGTNRDIGERIRQEQALQSSEEQFRGAMEHSAIGMAIVGLDGRWLKVNPALCAITGYPAAELLRLTFTDITHPEDRAISPGQLQALLTGRHDTYQIEKRYVHKRGHAVWVQASVSLVRDATGRGRHLISQIVDVSERRRLQDRVEHLALHDPLTDLPNSRLMLDRLEQGLAAARRANRMIGVMYIDLDGFKPINDTHGHDAGDQVLKQFASRLKGALRAVDSVARIGGDEFVAILAEISNSGDASKAADRVLACLGEPFHLGGTPARLSASIGLTLFPVHGEDAQSLLQRADTAMYQAKHAGKNGYRFFEAASHKPVPSATR